MTLSVGVALQEGYDAYYKANSLTPANVLTAIDAYKNALADELSLAHTDVASAQLYPSTFAVFITLADPNNVGSHPGPQGAAFPYTDLMDGLRNRGITPLIYWQPTGANWPGSWSVNLSGWDPSVSTWQNWANGTFNDYLDRFATDYKAWAVSDNSTGLTSQGGAKSSEVILRVAQEMNTLFFPWATTDGTHHTNNTPTTFKAGWRYIHDRLRVVNGATNLNLHFCPWPNDASAINTIKAIYPGDAYCEYIGADVYCSGTPWASVPSLRSKLSTLYADLAALGSGTQPMILGETGVTTAGTDAQRKSWFNGSSWTGSGSAGGYTDASTRYPRIRNITYFDLSGWLFNHASWPLTNAAYATLANTFSTRLTAVAPSSLKVALPIQPVIM